MLSGMQNIDRSAIASKKPSSNNDSRIDLISVSSNVLKERTASIYSNARNRVQSQQVNNRGDK